MSILVYGEYKEHRMRSAKELILIRMRGDLGPLTLRVYKTKEEITMKIEKRKPGRKPEESWKPS